MFRIIHIEGWEPVALIQFTQMPKFGILVHMEQPKSCGEVSIVLDGEWRRFRPVAACCQINVPHEECIRRFECVMVTCMENGVRMFFMHGGTTGWADGSPECHDVRCWNLQRLERELGEEYCMRVVRETLKNVRVYEDLWYC